jgi:hypothetical protein
MTIRFDSFFNQFVGLGGFYIIHPPVSKAMSKTPHNIIVLRLKAKEWIQVDIDRAMHAVSTDFRNKFVLDPSGYMFLHKIYQCIHIIMRFLKGQVMISYQCKKTVYLCGVLHNTKLDIIGGSLYILM